MFRGKRTSCGHSDRPRPHLGLWVCGATQERREALSPFTGTAHFPITDSNRTGSELAILGAHVVQIGALAEIRLLLGRLGVTWYGSRSVGAQGGGSQLVTQWRF